MTGSIEVVEHAAVSPPLVDELRRLFDAEYLADCGDWDPEGPYGYASHDVHVVARVGADIVGHVGWARRTISVGVADVVIAGVGGVLVAADTRGARLGERLMHAAHQSMLATGDIQFGYLGCREAVVPFYSACGWQRISAGERSVSRTGQAVESSPGHPLLILPVSSPFGDWPVGTIDLRGRAW